MTETELLGFSRYSSQEINLTCLYVFFLYTIFNPSWSGLDEIKSARRYVNFQCWKAILPSKFDLHTQVSFSILSSRRCTMPPKHVICGILKQRFIILFLNFKVGKFRTFCAYIVVFVLREEQDHVKDSDMYARVKSNLCLSPFPCKCLQQNYDNN